MVQVFRFHPYDFSPGFYGLQPVLLFAVYLLFLCAGGSIYNFSNRLLAKAQTGMYEYTMVLVSRYHRREQVRHHKLSNDNRSQNVYTQLFVGLNVKFLRNSPSSMIAFN
jgi:hypothetical protein